MYEVPGDRLRELADAARVLTIEQADWLGQLIRAVQRGAKMRYYPRGVEDSTPASVVLRAFTYDGGNLYPHDKDIRDSFVWTSGTFEHWHRVEALLQALENALSGKYGIHNPMAVIEEEK